MDPLQFMPRPRELEPRKDILQLFVDRFWFDVLNYTQPDQLGMQYYRAVIAFWNFQQTLFQGCFQRQQVYELVEDFTESLVIVTNSALLGADMVEKFEHIAILIGNFRRTGFLEDFDIGQSQPIALGVGRQNFETLDSESGYSEQAIGAVFPIIDRGCRPHRVDIGLDECFFSLVNQNYSKQAIRAHAVGDHVDVTRFENLESQRVTR